MIEYRRATADDSGDLVELRIKFLKEAQSIASAENDPQLRTSLSRYFAETMNDGSFIAWLASDEGRIVATSGLCFYTLPPSFKNLAGKVAYIMNMYTEPRYRGQGLATHLFARMLDEARSLGYKKICLHATAQGRPVYEKFGFRGTDDEMVFWLE